MWLWGHYGKKKGSSPFFRVLKGPSKNRKGRTHYFARTDGIFGPFCRKVSKISNDSQLDAFSVPRGPSRALAKFAMLIFLDLKNNITDLLNFLNGLKCIYRALLFAIVARKSHQMVSRHPRSFRKFQKFDWGQFCSGDGLTQDNLTQSQVCGVRQAIHHKTAR